MRRFFTYLNHAIISGRGRQDRTLTNGAAEQEMVTAQATSGLHPQLTQDRLDVLDCLHSWFVENVVSELLLPITLPLRSLLDLLPVLHCEELSLLLHQQPSPAAVEED